MLSFVECVKLRKDYGIRSEDIARHLGITRQAVCQAERQGHYVRADEYRDALRAEMVRMNEAIKAAMEVTR